MTITDSIVMGADFYERDSPGIAALKRYNLRPGMAGAWYVCSTYHTVVG